MSSSRVPKDRSKMRTGFTTGANACAAAVAALRVLTGHELDPWEGTLPELTADRYDTLVGSVTIAIPNGDRVRFAVRTAERDPDAAVPVARCSVIKDGGDDPDCTHRAEIWAAVRLTERPGEVELIGGPGVGQITRPGLGLPVGGPAINPVPRRNITEQLAELLPPGAGAEVTIGVLGGEEMAKKTLNARLGIVGGISILGTTGIVRPYSTAAFRASVSQAIDVAGKLGLQEIVVTTGGRSERFGQALRNDLCEQAFVQMGDFVGHALSHASRTGIRRITICGMMGKLSKMADGRTMTHAKGSAVNMVLLSDLARKAGVPEETCAEILDANTGRHVAELVTATGHQDAFFGEICERVQVVLLDHLSARFPEPPELCVLFVDFGGALLGRWPAHALTPLSQETIDA
ncbi:MAG: cobalt-precorrin-5B (C(1))-methyltransferase [Myxococcota bacterium]|nr:cobalt-precorrin-5B (C(1))-methyltransferase [Myxococcota bacterium]